MENTSYERRRADALIQTLDAIRATYCDGQHGDPIAAHSGIPSLDEVVRILANLEEIFYPGYRSGNPACSPSLDIFIRRYLDMVYDSLYEQVVRALPFRWKGEYGRAQGIPAIENVEAEAERIVGCFFSRLPAIRELLKKDVIAAYTGDPAAHSYAEVILSYPAIRAITVHRVAHELYRLGVPIIPRMMSEHVHSETGIDIHPGARIGESFFIDHGTGVVIGETTEIGNRVKIYQGVTLGAKSFPLDAHGNPIKAIKRHPTLEDDVIIYAGATILGGDTVIGQGSVIGGNVWITSSVPPHSTVLHDNPKPIVKKPGT
ncbi:MAG TPA: serine acetyltransferase [Armatimonadota bacterium]|jgi:serine O-acetyltransferase|nr:serine acetyltransferase [Armatimonadota bacterium]HOQ28732.1 serine acetyltransferase [Armatimonadota bacterium]HPT99256.1 serine acetyltransferase [Armatimonadota bacterium]